MTAVSSSAHAVLISGRAARARTLTLNDGRVVASRVTERGVASGRNGSCAAFQTHPAAGYCFISAMVHRATPRAALRSRGHIDYGPLQQ